MKAKEYYEKYYNGLMSEDEKTQLKAGFDLVLDMNDDLINIMNVRHATSDSALFSAIKEQNQKWNAICTLFYKKNEQCPLKENGFLNYWKAKMPDLKLLEERNGRT